MRSDQRNGPPSSVIGRITAILEVIASATGSVGISEIAAATGLAKGSVHRLVVQLLEQRLVERDENARLTLGVRLFELGTRVPLPRTLAQVARPLMVDLHQATDRQVHLAVLDGVEVVYVEIVRGGLPLASSIGGRLPAHATGVGKALLAYSPRAVVTERVNAGLDPMTPHSIATAADLDRALRDIRTNGTSYDHEESQRGISCVAAPVFGADKKVRAALSVTGQTTRMDLPRLGVAVRTAAFTLSRQLRDAGL